MIQPVSTSAVPRSLGVPDAADPGGQARNGNLLFGDAMRAQNESGGAEAPKQDAAASEAETPGTPQKLASAEDTPAVPARRGRTADDAEARPATEANQAADPSQLSVAAPIANTEVSEQRGQTHLTGKIANSTSDLAAASDSTEPSTLANTYGADTHGKTDGLLIREGTDSVIQDRKPDAAPLDLDAIHGLTSEAPGAHVDVRGAITSGDALQSPMIAGPVSVASQTLITAAAAPEFQQMVQNGVSEVPQPARVEKMPDLVVKHLEARAGESSRLVVQLDPPELGRVAIEFQFEGTELRKLVVIGETADAMRQLRQIHYALSEALSEHGVDGGQMDFRQESNGRERRDGAPEQDLSRNRSETPGPVSAVINRTTRPMITDGQNLNIKL